MNHDVAVKHSNKMDKTISGESVPVTLILVRALSTTKQDTTVVLVTDLWMSDRAKVPRRPRHETRN